MAGVARDGWNLLKALQRASVLAEKMFSQSNFSKNRSLAVPFTNYQRPNSANDSSVTNRLWWINYHNKPRHIKPLWSWHGFSLTELRQSSELKGRNQSNVHQTVSSSNRRMLYMSTKSSSSRTALRTSGRGLSWCANGFITVREQMLGMATDSMPVIWPKRAIHTMTPGRRLPVLLQIHHRHVAFRKLWPVLTGNMALCSSCGCLWNQDMFYT